MERRLSLILRASALYDLVALALLWAMPAWLFTLFEHPRPAEPFLFRMAALPLLMAPVVYWMASEAPLRRDAMVRASIGLRVVGGLGIAALVIAHAPAGALAYWSFVVGDAFWAAWIAVERRRLSSRAPASR